MLISPAGVLVSGGGVGEVSVSRNCGGDIFQSQGHVRAKKNSRSCSSCDAASVSQLAADCCACCMRSAPQLRLLGIKSMGGKSGGVGSL